MHIQARNILCQLQVALKCMPIDRALRDEIAQDAQYKIADGPDFGDLCSVALPFHIDRAAFCHRTMRGQEPKCSSSAPGIMRWQNERLVRAT